MQKRSSKTAIWQDLNNSLDAICSEDADFQHFAVEKPSSAVRHFRALDGI
jgi:hypothetical protein